MIRSEHLHAKITVLFALVVQIVHFIFFFIFDISDYENILESFDESPFYDFRVSGSDCGIDEFMIFYIWQGIEIKELQEDDYPRIEVEGRTHITKLNGNYFCYKKKKSYKELLLNNNIIKKNESCKEGYKNCGIIDTLEQQLCIPENEKCPLYEVGIAKENDEQYINNTNYEYKEDAKIYYNNENYDKNKKKIIGTIILNDGQPCYNTHEKKWRKFIDNEVADTHLTCEYVKIFGNTIDNRFENKGDVTYYNLYRYNLGEYFDLFEGKVKDLKSNYIALYTREFIGIKKECDGKFDISKENLYKLQKSQRSEIRLLLAEPIIFVLFFLSLIFGVKDDEEKKIIYGALSGMSLLIFSSLICHIVFLVRIAKLDFSNYECSDEITNEYFKQENSNTKKTKIYTAVNLVGDGLIFVVFFSVPLFYLISERCSRCRDKFNNNQNNNNINKTNMKTDISTDIMNKDISNSSETNVEKNKNDDIQNKETIEKNNKSDNINEKASYK